MVVTVVTDSVLICIHEKITDSICIYIRIAVKIADSITVFIYKIVVSTDTVTVRIHKAFPKIAASDMTSLDLFCGMNGNSRSKHYCAGKSHRQQFLHIKIPPKK